MFVAGRLLYFAQKNSSNRPQIHPAGHKLIWLVTNFWQDHHLARRMKNQLAMIWLASPNIWKFLFRTTKPKQSKQDISKGCSFFLHLPIMRMFEENANRHWRHKMLIDKTNMKGPQPFIHVYIWSKLGGLADHFQWITINM